MIRKCCLIKDRDRISSIRSSNPNPSSTKNQLSANKTLRSNSKETPSIIPKIQIKTTSIKIKVIGRNFSRKSVKLNKKSVSLQMESLLISLLRNKKD